jgi:hypothetical protein
MRRTADHHGLGAIVRSESRSYADLVCPPMADHPGVISAPLYQVNVLSRRNSSGDANL